MNRGGFGFSRRVGGVEIEEEGTYWGEDIQLGLAKIFRRRLGSYKHPSITFLESGQHG